MSFLRTFRPTGRDDQPEGPILDSSGDPGLVSLPPQAIRQLDRLQLSASRFVPGMGAGLRSSLRRKAGANFREHRIYVPGDDLRYVDWRASARHENIFVKQEEHPREISIQVLIDCSASMGWGDPPKHSAAVSLAAALGYLALAHADRLVVYPFTDKIGQPLGPISGKGQVPTLFNYLRKLQFKGSSSFVELIKDLKRQVAKGGLTLIISDLLGTTDLAPALARLPAPSWDVVVFHLLHPEEISPSAKGDFQMIDVETNVSVNYDINADALETYKSNMDTWRKSLDLSCIEHNAFYTMIPSNWSISNEVIPHLRSVQIVTPM